MVRRVLAAILGLALAGGLASCFSSSNASPSDASLMEAEAASSDDAPSPEASAADVTVDQTSSTDGAGGDTSAADVTAGDSAADASDGGPSSPCPSFDGGGSTDGGSAPSCTAAGPGLSNCGVGGAESCCASLEVSGGTYFRTYASGVDGGPTGEADPATVSGFRLDKYDVTVGRFRQFVTAWNSGGGYTPPAGSGKHVHLNCGQGLNSNALAGGYETGWLAADNTNVAPTDANLQCDSSYQTWTTMAGSNENRPINCVRWAEAYAFCIWDGGFLPSEAEWEYAAAGGSEQRQYAWGSAPPATASQYAIYGCYYPSGSGSCTGIANVATVGTATSGAGRWGQLDLAGNVWQWILDDGYANYGPCTDCVTPATSANAGIRGGMFSGLANFLVSTSRHSFMPTGGPRYAVHGFRCARTP